MDLATSYLGLALKNPLVVAASRLGWEIGNIRKMEDSGAAAVVLPSVFQEEVEGEIDEVDRLLTETGAEATTYFPHTLAEIAGPESYLKLVERARQAVDIPVIASLNGTSLSGWTDFSKRLAEAGASAIELNVFFLPTDLSLSGRDVEQRHIDIVKAVKNSVSIPVAVKLSPYFSSTGHMVRALDEAGADGFVLFNRFYQPDIDLSDEHIALARTLRLSHRSEIRLPLLWIGALAGHVRGSLCASTGVNTAQEVFKYLLVGADVVSAASALMRFGVTYVRSLLDGLVAELDAREFDSVAAARGRLSRKAVGDPSAFDRANYIRILKAGQTTGDDYAD
jgi:dihydroorotate dehydrogenase (fumarate)